MTEPRSSAAADTDLVRALCEEARTLASGLKGPVSRLRLQAGDHAVEVEWELTPVVLDGGSRPLVTATTAPASDGEHGVPEAADEALHPIVAPLLGTFYRSPEPGAKPFVEEGDVVEAGQDVAIVEAMKIMNRVQADRSGRVAKISAADGDMVEYGQALMLLEPLDGGM
jgi:acetyl-CoA carboxylase biotin carboxyl carrier protein